MNIHKTFQLIYLLLALWFAFDGNVEFTILCTGLMIVKKMARENR